MGRQLGWARRKGKEKRKARREKDGQRFKGKGKEAEKYRGEKKWGTVWGKGEIEREGETPDNRGERRGEGGGYKERQQPTPDS